MRVKIQTRQIARQHAYAIAMSTRRIFLLSPANSGGERAKLLLRDEAQFDLALRVRSQNGASLGEIFSFLSGLYFRGKRIYAAHFAQPPAGLEGAYVITTNRGLVPIETIVRLDELCEMAQVPIDLNEPRYREPLERTAAAVARGDDGCEVVLLGSIATGKYVDVLLEIFGARLRFPAEFVGRGDMSRGGLMLRCVDEGRELTYIALDGAMRRGSRPARLTPRSAGSSLR
jgi:hypothetical protein